MGPLIQLLRTAAVARRFLQATCFRTSRPGRRIGLVETAADRTPSIPCSRRMSPVASTRTVPTTRPWRSEEHTSELQSRLHLVCRLLLEKKKKNISKKRPPDTTH